MSPLKYGRTVLMSATLVVLVIYSMLYPENSAFACYVHQGQIQGLQTRHELSVPVSVATWQAIHTGQLTDIPRATEEQRLAALQQVSTIVGLFGKYSESCSNAAVPGFAVLLTESGLWTGFSAQNKETWKVRQHLSGPAENDVVLVISDPAMATLLQGKMTVEQSIQNGLLEISDVPEAEQSLMCFSHLISKFSQTNLARFKVDGKIPKLRFSRPTVFNSAKL